MKKIDDFFDGDIRVVGFSGGFCNVSIGSFSDDLFNFVSIIEILEGEDLVYIVTYGFSLYLLFFGFVFHWVGYVYYQLLKGYPN